MYKASDFTKYFLRRKKSGGYIWLSSLTKTAELYGWDQALPTLVEQMAADSPDGHFLCPSRRGFKNGGGREIRISRSPMTQGWPAGFTNAFRVSSDATVLDLAYLTQSVQIDWEWMTCLHGGRRSRSWWDETALSRGVPTRRSQVGG